MKRLILLAIGIVLMASVCWANPFLICDAQTGVTYYKLTGPDWVPVTSTAIADGSLKLDVATATVGTSSLTVAACKTDATWGELCSVFVPFALVRPASATVPANTRLSP
jgi:hypothetical protein